MFVIFAEVNYVQGGNSNAETFTICCPSLYDSMFESEEQLNFENNFQQNNNTNSNNQETETDIARFINGFLCKSNDDSKEE